MPFDRPAPTLADVIERLQAKRLPAARQRDLISALRRIARILDCKPGDLPADVPVLSARLSQLNAAEVGVAAKTWANLRANFMAALDASGVAIRMAAKKSARSEAWTALLAERPLQVRNGLSRLATWGSQESVAPQNVDEAAIERFEDAVRSQTLVRSPESKFRRMRQIWNGLAVDAALGIKALELTKANKPVRIPWERLPASFRADVEAHLAWGAGDDMFAESARPKPLAPRSVRLRRDFIHSAASSLVEAGWSPEQITNLKTLTSPVAFRAAMGHRYNVLNKRPNAYNASLAKGLLAIAKEWGNHDGEALAALKCMLTRIPTQQAGLTNKNKKLLRCFDDSDKLDDLIRLPGSLWAAALKRDDPVRRLADAQAALAIGILTFAPLRRSNLAELTFGEHVFLPKQLNAETPVELPAAAMKTREAFSLVLPPSLTRMLRTYEGLLGEYVRGAKRSLFINVDGSRKGGAAVARLVETALSRHLGIRMTCHQFRHLAAKIMLDADPGAYETLRQLLGHKNLKTTTGFYVELDTKRVSRIHAGMIERRLARATGKRRPLRGEHGR